MSSVKLTSSDLFLGSKELVRLFDYQGIGASNRVDQLLIEKFGVSKKASDVAFTNLKVIEGSDPSMVTIQAGDALDKDVNHISVLTDQVDALTMATDSTTRYVVVKYATKNLEEGTIDIAANGSIVGTGTTFTDYLRPLPEFPVRLRFPDSAGNTGEYTILSVQSDTQAQLNTASTMVVESGVEFKVLGTFTPGSTLSEADRTIYDRDSYVFELRGNDTIIDGEEFLLASVSSDGVTLNISDLRQNNILTLIGAEDEAGSDITTVSNLLIGYEQQTYDFLGSDRGNNLVRVGWGFRSADADNTPDEANNRIDITDGNGGMWLDTTSFTAGDFNGWRCYFEDGSYLKIVDSTVAGTIITITFDNYDSQFNPVTGAITIVPDADEIVLRSQVTGTATPAAATQNYLPIHLGYYDVKLMVQKTHKMFFRLSKGGVLSSEAVAGIASHTPYAVTAFNDAGTLTGTDTTTANVGVIFVTGDVNRHHEAKAWLNQEQSFTATQTFGVGATINNTGSIISLGADGNSFLTDMQSAGVNFMTIKDVGTDIYLHLNQVVGAISTVTFTNDATTPPSGMARFLAQDNSGVGGTVASYPTGAIVHCKMMDIGGTLHWVIMGASTNSNSFNFLTELQSIVSGLATVGDPWVNYNPQLTNWTNAGGAGTINVTAHSMSYKEIGSTVFFRFTVSMTVTSGVTVVDLGALPIAATTTFKPVGSLIMDLASGPSSHSFDVAVINNTMRLTKTTGPLTSGDYTFTQTIIYEKA